MSKMTLFKKAGLRNCCSSYYLVLLRLVMNATGVYIPLIAFQTETRDLESLLQYYQHPLLEL